jgi:ABC-type multidrug transport system ATPase subunit
VLLKAYGISKRFGRNLALQDASFSIGTNEIVGLIGPNGSGKTTLFECVAGLIPVDSGKIEFEGRALTPSHRKQKLFYLPDGIRPWPDQSVGWLLSFFEALYSRSKGAGAALATSLKLELFLKSRVGSLSKGELKRTLLALGLLTPHPLLLLDEPFDGLDFRQTRDVMELLRGQTSHCIGRLVLVAAVVEEPSEHCAHVDGWTLAGTQIGNQLAQGGDETLEPGLPTEIHVHGGLPNHRQMLGRGLVTETDDLLTALVQAIAVEIVACHVGLHGTSAEG